MQQNLATVGTDLIVITDSADESRRIADDGANHTTLYLKSMALMAGRHDQLALRNGGRQNEFHEAINELHPTMGCGSFKTSSMSFLTEHPETFIRLDTRPCLLSDKPRTRTNNFLAHLSSNGV